MSYNPNTGLVYIPVEHRNWGFVVAEQDDNPMGMKLSISLANGPRLHDELDIPLVHETFMLAWDPVNQRVALRYSPALASQDLFDNIVLQGVRSENGMVSFDTALDPEDTVALRVFLTARANELRPAQARPQ